jgi:hypothetical protein
MERDRTQIIGEYIGLRDFLNRANKRSGEITKIDFEIRLVSRSIYRLDIVCAGPGEKHRLALADRNRSGHWERTGVTRFRYFEAFCADFLNALEQAWYPSVQSRGLSSEHLQKLQNLIRAEIKMLLLKGGYEP